MLHNKLINEYYILVMFTEEVTITEDIKVKITNTKLETTKKMSFYYWLSARFVLYGVGKVV